VPAKPPARGATTTAAAPRSPLTSASTITVGVAFTTWLAGWLIGNVAGSIVIEASGYANVSDAARPAWVATASAVALWVPQLVAMFVVCLRFGSKDPIADYSLRFRPVDLAGIPIGVLSQLVLLRLVYWPLQNAWPGTFSNHHLEQNARDLYDSAKGVWVVVLIATIVVAAPFVEELVYRGLLMGAARRRFDDVVALIGVAAFFALIHFRPVEYPGLFAFGLVLGACLLATNRIGMGMIAHLSFNATALALVAR